MSSHLSLPAGLGREKERTAYPGVGLTHATPEGDERLQDAHVCKPPVLPEVAATFGRRGIDAEHCRHALRTRRVCGPMHGSELQGDWGRACRRFRLREVG